MRKIVFTSLIVLAACTRGPLKQVDQARNSGGLFVHFSNPIVQDSQLSTDGTRLYYGTRHGHLYAISSKNLHRVWKFNFDSSVDTTALVDQGKLYVGTGDAMVHALDANNGKTIWTAKLSAPPRGKPVKFGSFVMVGNNDGVLEAFNAENGQSVWKYRQEPFEKMKIQFLVDGNSDQNVLYSAFPNGQVVALQLDSGVEIWKQFVVDSQSRFYDISSVLLIPQKGVLVTSVDGAAVMLSLTTGQQLWSLPGVSTQSSAILDGDMILIAAKDRLIWLDVDGHEKSSMMYPKTIRPAGVATTANHVYVSSLDGGLHVFDKKTAQWLWNYEIGISIQGAPIILNDRIYILNRRGQIIAMQVR